MALAQLIPGSRFRLYREPVPGQLRYVAIASTLSFTTATALADRKVIGRQHTDVGAGARSWMLSFAGKADVLAFREIEEDEASNKPLRYTILLDLDVDRSYSGFLLYEKLERGKQDRSFVSFSATCRGHGALVIT